MVKSIVVSSLVRRTFKRMLKLRKLELEIEQEKLKLCERIDILDTWYIMLADIMIQTAEKIRDYTQMM